jgi:SagB-type dehydrogenase family enzyme
VKPADSSALAAQSGAIYSRSGALLLCPPWKTLPGTLSRARSTVAARFDRSCGAISHGPKSVSCFGPPKAPPILRPDCRTVPSAGALYPLELDVVIASGVFRYRPQEHRLAPRLGDDIREAVSQAAHRQAWLADAPCVLSFAAVMRRTARKYASRASRLVHLEAGHAAQNALLVATALGLAGTPVGPFDDAILAQTLRLERAAEPVYLVAVGWPTE